MQRGRVLERGGQPEHVDVVCLDAARLLDGEHLHHIGAGQQRLVALAEPPLGHGCDRLGKLARGCLRHPGDVGRGQLAEARQRSQPLHHLGLGCEQLLPAQAQAVDQPVHVEVGPHRVDLLRAGAVELQEQADALAGLGWNLR